MATTWLHSQYNELLQFLRNNSHCWDHEVLHSYPHYLEKLPPAWLDSLAKLNRDQLWLMDSKQDFSFIDNAELRELFTKLEQLTQLPAIKTTSTPHQYDHAAAFYGVRGKKRHEIETLAPVLKQLKQQHQFKRVIDIGGGQGHLARVLARHFGVPTLSLDRDEKLQALGQINLKRLAHRPPPAGAAELEFQQCELSHEHTPACFDSQSFVLGLHTCGDLAVDLLAHTHHAGCIGVMSFGCCYSKMRLDDTGHAINGPQGLKLNMHALTLATRGHRSDTRKDYDLKLLVKRHRYTLHLFHYHQRDLKRFIPMGETVAREYRGKFSEYALPRLQAHGIEATAQELDNFYHSEWVHKEFEQMLRANLIRWQFGRALELVILFERAIKLEEKGMKVEVATYFDEHQSPRNIGILAYT